MTPHSAAEQINKAIIIRGKAEGKEFTRFQLSHKSLSQLCEREIITETYMRYLADELIAIGWCCFQVTSSSYAFLKLSTAQNFRRLNSDTLLNYLNTGE